jgi:hypothetical protein
LTEEHILISDTSSANRSNSLDIPGTQSSPTIEGHWGAGVLSMIKVMMDIFDLLEEAHRNGRAVAVNWYYDPRNERVAELADEFKEDCSFPFSIRARGE